LKKGEYVLLSGHKELYSHSAHSKFLSVMEENSKKTYGNANAKRKKIIEVIKEERGKKSEFGWGHSHISRSLSINALSSSPILPSSRQSAGVAKVEATYGGEKRQRPSE
jgi:hypothetical protein